MKSAPAASPATANCKGNCTMATRDEIFPSKYLKVADLKGKPFVVTITSADTETLKAPDGKESTKTVLSFKGTRKTLPLNMTNWDAVAGITGEDDSMVWSGHQIELFPSTTDLRGKTVDCIRIRPPAQRGLPKPKAKPEPEELVADMDDEIPF
jgi:hypothetical protein